MHVHICRDRYPNGLTIKGTDGGISVLLLGNRLGNRLETVWETDWEIYWETDWCQKQFYQLRQ